MKIFNIRQGFATNSSSSHSILVVPKDSKKYASIVDSEELTHFGWDFFTLKSSEKKLEYVMSLLDDSIKTYIKGEEKRIQNIFKILQEAEVKIELEDVRKYIKSNKKGVDHQSKTTLPGNYMATEIHKEFAIDYVKYMLQEEVVILGGNDNTSHTHPYSKKGKLSEINQLPAEQSSKKVIAVKQENYWLLFNRDNGNKIRFSFDSNALETKKAKVPELVDIKITDYCPYDCDFCYQDSTLSGKHAKVEDMKKIVNELNKKEVLEVALGGGETTLHPEFINILKEFYDNKVVPNFTTKNHNLLRQENAQEILKYCGAIAFSVENSNEMKKVILSQKQINIENKIDLGYISYYNHDDKKEWTSKVVFQIVLGVQSEEEFKKMLGIAKEFDVKVTLLGFKEYGRGQEFAPYKYDNWLEIVKPFLNNGNISIDTALAGEFSDLLEKEKVPKNTYHTVEGAFSLYIDAVKMEMAPSSYIGKEQSKKFDENWIEQYKDLYVDAKNEKKKYIKIKNI